MIGCYKLELSLRKGGDYAALERHIVHKVSEFGGDPVLFRFTDTSETERHCEFQFDRRPLGPELLQAVRQIAGPALFDAVCISRDGTDLLISYAAS